MAATSAKSKKRPATKKAKPATKNVDLTERVYAPLPNVIQLTKQTIESTRVHIKVLSGITLVYGLLSLLLVRGLGAGINVAQLRDQAGNHVAGSLATYFELLGNNSDASNPNAGVYQTILFIIGSLAIIWALRQLAAGERPSVKDAYYRGMYPLVPFVLVLLVILVQLLPAVIGLAAYQFLSVGGVINSIAGALVVGIFVLALAVLSMYMLASSFFALYIVTLPGMEPMVALKTAKKLVTGRRWTLLRKLLFLLFVIFAAMAVIMVPFILVVPVLASWVLFALGIVAVAVGHAYSYNLYQRLLDEQQTE